jgi:hypothetical protein
MDGNDTLGAPLAGTASASHAALLEFGGGRKTVNAWLLLVTPVLV